MQNFMKRVVEEKNDLESKIEKLNNFIEYSETYSSVPEDEQQRLESQLYHMKKYRDILEERINNSGE